MSKYAYRDEMRTDEIPAKDAQKTDRNTRFYCPNPKCDAHLYIASVNGSVSAYFTANDEKHPHIDGCDFYEKNTKITAENFHGEEKRKRRRMKEKQGQERKRGRKMKNSRTFCKMRELFLEVQARNISVSSGT